MHDGETAVAEPHAEALVTENVGGHVDQGAIFRGNMPFRLFPSEVQHELPDIHVHRLCPLEDGGTSSSNCTYSLVDVKRDLASSLP